MIIFTVTNKVTKQVYVGSTRNDLESQWEKMVAAALQDMDYPLYREIRIQGEENFTVEEWDRAESREELCELEQDALDFFEAKSLKGYKTSTVKILPKKKQRQRKSSIEKELASIFGELIDSDDEVPPSLAIKQKTDDAEQDQPPAVLTQPESHSAAAKPASDRLAEMKVQFAKQNEELVEERAVAKAPEATAVKTQQPTGSRANAMVKMNGIELSDDITAQLAAITAAADACLAGDTDAAKQLSEVSIQNDVPEVAAVTSIHPATPSVTLNKADEHIEVEPACPKTLRIREAIERHRKQRAQQTTEARENYKNKIASMLAELDARARELHSGTFAAVA